MIHTIRAFFWLLWPRWRSLSNAPRSRDGRSRLRLLIFGTLGLSFMIGGFLGARWLFMKFIEVEFLAELLIRRVLGIVLLFFTGLLIFSNTITAFSTYFLADDLPLLISSPIPVGRLYLSRLVDTWAASSWMMMVFALPILAGCGPVLSAPWWFYPLLPLILLPLTVICAAVGSWITLGLARFLPAHRTQDILLVLAVVGFLVVYVAFRLAEPEKFLNPDGFDDLIALVGSLREASAPTMPSDWVVLSMSGLIRRDLPTALPALAALFTGAGAACVIGAWLSRSIYLHSFAVAQEGRGETEGWRRRLTNRLSRPARIPKTAIAGLINRDTRIFFRTTGQWTQLLLIAALVIVYIFNFKHFQTLQETGVMGPMGMLFVNIALGGLVVVTVAARFLYPAISLEGRAFWAIQVAPIEPETLLKAKLHWGFRPLLALGLTLTVISELLVDLSVTLLWISIGYTVVTTWALSGMGVGLGAITPQFHVDNPAKIASGIGGVTYMLGGLAYLVVFATLLAAPIWAFNMWVHTGYVPRSARLLLYIGLVIAALGISATIHYLPLRLGARALRTYGER